MIYLDGIASVLFIGDRARVNAAIDKLASALDGQIMQRYGAGAAGCYRAGVSAPLPDDVISVSNA